MSREEMANMKNIILLFFASVLFAADAQFWPSWDQIGFGAGGGSVEFKSKEGAHVKARKYGSAMSMGGMNMDNRPNPLFSDNLRKSPPGDGDDFFKNFPTPAGTPNIGGHKGLSDFFQHLGSASAGSTNMGSAEGMGAASGRGIVFGEGFGASEGAAGGVGMGRGRGIVGNGNVIGHGQGFGMGFGQGGAQGYGRGPDMTNAMKTFQGWLGRK